MTEQYLQKSSRRNGHLEKNTCHCNKNRLLKDDFTFIELLHELNILSIDQVPIVLNLLSTLLKLNILSIAQIPIVLNLLSILLKLGPTLGPGYAWSTCNRLFYPEPLR